MLHFEKLMQNNDAIFVTYWSVSRTWRRWTTLVFEIKQETRKMARALLSYMGFYKRI